jgi:hypothetical protein
MTHNTELGQAAPDPAPLAGHDTISSRIRDVSLTAVAGVIASILTLVGVYTTGWFNYASKDDELRVKLVEMAIGILKEPKTAGEAQPRNWAIDVMEKNTGVKMIPEERKLLVDLGGLKTAPVSVSPGDVYRVGACENGKREIVRYDANLQPVRAESEPC